MRRFAARAALSRTWSHRGPRPAYVQGTTGILVADSRYMTQQQISLLDWKRLLLGKAPASFLLELLVRFAVVYLVLLVVARLFGKRLSGRISNLELAVTIMLGAIVAAPVEFADRGLLAGLALLICVMLLQRGLGEVQARSRSAEKALLGRASIVIRDGTIRVPELRKAAVSQQHLFSALRAGNIRQLGQLKRVYLEAYGFFSIIPQSPPRPGLPILPTFDQQISERLVVQAGQFACGYCGLVLEQPPADCPNCGHDQFGPAVLEPEPDPKRPATPERAE